MTENIKSNFVFAKKKVIKNKNMIDPSTQKQNVTWNDV